MLCNRFSVTSLSSFVTCTAPWTAGYRIIENYISGHGLCIAPLFHTTLPPPPSSWYFFFHSSPHPLQFALICRIKGTRPCALLLWGVFKCPRTCGKTPQPSTSNLLCTDFNDFRVDFPPERGQKHPPISRDESKDFSFRLQQEWASSGNISWTACASLKAPSSSRYNLLLLTDV